MASATARPTFFFHHLHPDKPSKPSKPHLLIPLSNSGKPNFSSVSLHRHSIHHHHLPLPVSSVDVSKEDKPLSQPPDPAIPEPPPAPADAPPAPETIQDAVEDATEEAQEDALDRRRLEEKFAVLNTGIYECRSCGYRYDKAAGDPSYPIPPGLDFEKLPEDWRCATCGAAKSFFVSKRVEIAGFAENQQFGLGGNSLTSGQKALLIYGSLLLAFALFLAGYFLQ